MTWVYKRANRLLQLAPWADMDLVREPLIIKCEEIIEQGRSLPLVERRIAACSTDVVENTRRFKEGLNPVLPSTIAFTTAFYNVITRAFQEFDNDLRWADANREIRTYFFVGRHWEFKGPV